MLKYLLTAEFLGLMHLFCCSLIRRVIMKRDHRKAPLHFTRTRCQQRQTASWTPSVQDAFSARRPDIPPSVPSFASLIEKKSPQVCAVCQRGRSAANDQYPPPPHFPSSWQGVEVATSITASSHLIKRHPFGNGSLASPSFRGRKSTLSASNLAEIFLGKKKMPFENAPIAVFFFPPCTQPRM